MGFVAGSCAAAVVGCYFHSHNPVGVIQGVDHEESRLRSLGEEDLPFVESAVLILHRTQTGFSVSALLKLKKGHGIQPKPTGNMQEFSTPSFMCPLPVFEI